MPQPYDKSQFSPWALFKGNDIYWLGMASGEDQAWTIGLGWPDAKEIAAAKAEGIYATKVGLRPRA